MIESPTEAQARVIGPLLDLIRAEAEVLPTMARIAGFGGHPLYSLDELHVDDLIRVSDEWVRLIRVEGTTLIVSHPDTCCEWKYPSTVGESFTRAEPF